MTYIVHMSMSAHTTAPCSICLFGVCPCCLPVLTWTNLSACGCLLAPQGGITVTTRPIHSQHYILSNCCKLVRAPRPLCRCRPPHESHMMQRLQVLCTAHRPRSVLPIHRFGLAPPALSQMTFCQLRSLRLPRSSPLLPFWSVASLLTLPHRPSYQSPPHFGMPLRRLFHTPVPLGTFPRNSRSGSSWLHLLLLTFAALRVLDQSPRHLLMRLCRRLYTALQLMMPLQRPLTEFFIGCILSNDPLDRQALPSAHCNAGSASPPQPPDIATLCSPSSASHASDGHEHTTAPHVLLEPPPGLQKKARQYASHCTPVKAAPVRPRLCTSISVTSPQPHVSTTHVGSHPVRSAPTYKRSASTAHAGTHNPVGADPRAGTGLFPKPRALVLPTVKFGQSKPDGLGYIDTVDSDLMHHQFRLSILQWNPGPARRNPIQILVATCERFRAVILQEASDHVSHITDQFIAYTGNTDLAIVLNKDTIEPDPLVFAF